MIVKILGWIVSIVLVLSGAILPFAYFLGGLRNSKGNVEFWPPYLRKILKR